MKQDTVVSRSNQAGFTLIELMIAIAIVGILAALAVPAFASYLAKSRVAESVNYAQGCKSGYIEFYTSRGTIPAAIGDIGCSSVTTPNIASVVLTNTSGGGAAALPAIRVTLAGAGSALPADVQGHVIVLQPLDADGDALNTGDTIENWQCSITTAAGAAAGAAARTFVPAQCLNDVITAS